MTTTQAPTYLTGHLAPVPDEIDAGDVAGPAVAAVTLPRGVPAGFHGSWIED